MISFQYTLLHQHFQTSSNSENVLFISMSVEPKANRFLRAAHLLACQVNGDAKLDWLPREKEVAPLGRFLGRRATTQINFQLLKNMFLFFSFFFFFFLFIFFWWGGNVSQVGMCLLFPGHLSKWKLKDALGLAIAFGN